MEFGSSGKTTEQIAGEAIDNYIGEYFKSDEFKNTIDSMTADAKMELIGNAETTARKWAALWAAIVFGVFLILSGIQYLEIREKNASIKTEQAEIKIKHAEAVELIGKIRSTLDELNSKTETNLNLAKGVEGKVLSLDSKIQNYENQFQGLSESLRQLRSAPNQ